MTGLSEEPSRSAHHHALDLRDLGEAGKWTIVDLDYRENFWTDEETAHREVDRILEKVSVAVGNKEECRIAVGETEPDRAADALLERGIEIAVVKQGPLGTLCKTRGRTYRSPSHPGKSHQRSGRGRFIWRLAMSRATLRLGFTPKLFPPPPPPEQS